MENKELANYTEKTTKEIEDSFFKCVSKRCFK